MTSSARDLALLRDVGETLRRTVRSGRISPAYLFEAADAEDAREAALLFAAEILAGGEPPTERLHRRVHSLDHPDVHLLERDKPTVISVAALSQELEAAYQTPLEAARQVFVIDPAEAMEAEGVARYLKILEEPPPATVFVLVSTRPDRLPATVLSRVRRVRLPPHDAATLALRLEAEGAGADEAARLAHWCGGSLARARRLRDADMASVAEALVHPSDGVAAAVDRALAALGPEAAARVDRGEGTNKRQEVRHLLQDLLHVLASEARDRVAGRNVALLGDLSEREALDRLEDVGALAAAVATNVTPAVLLMEVARRFGRA